MDLQQELGDKVPQQEGYHHPGGPPRHMSLGQVQADEDRWGWGDMIRGSGLTGGSTETGTEGFISTQTNILVTSRDIVFIDV